MTKIISQACTAHKEETLEKEEKDEP